MRSRSEGFSLIEVLVALMILTVVVTTSMAAFLERNRRLRQASETMLAYQALANEAEYRRRESFAELALLEKKPQQFFSDTTVLTPLDSYETIVSAKETQTGVRNVLMVIRWNNGKREAKLEIVRADTGANPLW